jgi:hypothetical protein
MANGGKAPSIKEVLTSKEHVLNRLGTENITFRFFFFFASLLVLSTVQQGKL